MFDVLHTINWISVILAFLAYFFLGALWYLLLFPKIYRISLGRDPNINASESPIYIIGPAVCAMIITLTCAIVLYALKINSVSDLFIFILLIGIGFLFSNTVNIGINPNIPRPFLYGMITGMYHLVGMVLVNVILFIMM
jgi:uncharacterized membrane protein